MKVVVGAGAVVVVGGLIVLAVAGIAGATAILVTVGALLAMVIVGGQMGGRHTPNVAPVARGPESPPAADPPGGPAPAAGGAGPDAGEAAPTEPTTDR
ncbi:MAG TPA: hypothetical protein VN799_03315 [Acidimicrobiales bacterium]|nr:hypothetical protein [Acidimicrobiales bacterium]